MAHSDEHQKFCEKLSLFRDKEGRVTDARKIDELFPKVSDITTRAEELYAFVSNGKQPNLT